MACGPLFFWSGVERPRAMARAIWEVIKRAPGGRVRAPLVRAPAATTVEAADREVRRAAAAPARAAPDKAAPPVRQEAAAPACKPMREAVTRVRARLMAASGRLR